MDIISKMNKFTKNVAAKCWIVKEDCKNKQKRGKQRKLTGRRSGVELSHLVSLHQIPVSTNKTQRNVSQSLITSCKFCYIKEYFQL